MAAGFTPTPTKPGTPTTGNIVNKGTIDVNGKGSIGMYATESGSTVENAIGSVINLNADNTTGIFLDNGARGVNRGTITTNTAGLSKCSWSICSKRFTSGKPWNYYN